MLCLVYLVSGCYTYVKRDSGSKLVVLSHSDVICGEGNSIKYQRLFQRRSAREYNLVGW